MIKPPQSARTLIVVWSKTTFTTQILEIDETF